MRGAAGALWAALALVLATGAAAKAHTYKQGQEVPIWANKGARRARLEAVWTAAARSYRRRRRRCYIARRPPLPAAGWGSLFTWLHAAPACCKRGGG